MRRFRFVAALGLVALMLALAPAGARAAEAAGPGSGPAAQIGPWPMAAQGRVQLGLAGTWTWEERFKDAIQTSVVSDAGAFQGNASDLHFEDDRMYQLRVAYGLHPRLSAYLSLGLAEGGRLWQTLGSGSWHAVLRPAFVYGGGLSGLVWQGPQGWGGRAGLEYLRYDNRGIATWYDPSGQPSESYGSAATGQVDYWRVSGGAVAYQTWGALTPWAGVSLAYAQFKENDRDDNVDGAVIDYDFASKSADMVGVTAGLNWQARPELSFGIMGNFLNRDEVGLLVSYGF